MIVYRLTKSSYKDDISGIGAQMYGGRWNSKGKRMLYTSSSRALCTTEIAVHVPLGLVPNDYYLQVIQIPENSMKVVDRSTLSPLWNTFPHIIETKLIGDQFLKNKQYLILKVPSAVIQDEYNYLINPLHSEFTKVKLSAIQKFRFDTRLFT